MTKSDIFWQVSQIILPILASVLTWAAARLAILIRAKTKNEWLRGALIRLDDAVVAVVLEVQQTIVDAIKEASSDGKLSAEEKIGIKAQAVETVKQHLGAKGLLDLAKILGLDSAGVEQMIGTKIEASVRAMKETTQNP